MHPTPITPDLSVAAPEIGRRLGVILISLVALIARAFLKHPRAALVLPLWRYFTRTTRRFNHLMAHLAAGRLPRKRAPSPTGARSGSRPVELPRTHAWLLIDLRHEGAYHRGQLEALLAEPAAAHLLATIPAASRLLRPLCDMLGLDTCRRPAVKTPKAPAPPPAVFPIPSFSEPSAQCAPAAPFRRHAPRPPPDVLQPRAAPSRALCPRARWPWFHRATSPA